MIVHSLLEQFHEYLEKEDTQKRLKDSLFQPAIEFSFQKLKYAIILGEIALVLVILQFVLTLFIFKKVVCVSKHAAVVAG